MGLSCFLWVRYPEISLWREGNAGKRWRKAQCPRVMEFNNSHMIVPPLSSQYKHIPLWQDLWKLPSSHACQLLSRKIT